MGLCLCLCGLMSSSLFLQDLHHLRRDLRVLLVLLLCLWWRGRLSMMLVMIAALLWVNMAGARLGGLVLLRFLHGMLCRVLSGRLECRSLIQDVGEVL